MSDEPKEERKNLVTKLTEVMGVIGRIEKSGWNDFHKYHFARESDIVEAIRGHLAERKVFILPSVYDCKRERFERTYKNETKTGFFTDILVRWQFIDGESGETLECAIPGCGEDSGDKGFYKAFTGSQKYMLMKAFMIPTGDDPEKDETPQPEAPRREYKLNAQPEAAPQGNGETWIEGKFSEVAASDDGKCWFVKVGKTNMWTRDEDLAQSIAAEHGREVSANGRMKPGGKSYQIISYVPKD